jgi:hypothetical protein
MRLETEVGFVSAASVAAMLWAGAGGAVAMIVWFVFPLWTIVLGLRPPPPATAATAGLAVI